MNHRFRSLCMATVCLALVGSTAFAVPFTYQGELVNANGPVTASCDLQLKLFVDPLAGVPIGTDGANDVAVNDGLFTVQLDFGPGAFSGGARYLEIGVKCPGDAGFTALPRQRITSSPYAITSYSTEGLQGIRVSNDAPTGGQVLQYDSVNDAWVPATLDVGGGDITSVIAGDLLSGGGTMDDVTLNVDDIICPSGEYVQAVSSGTVTCAPDQSAGGTVKSVAVASGSGLIASPSPITSVGTLDTDFGTIQRRVTGTCGGDRAVQGVNQDGSVVCSDNFVPSTTVRIPNVSNIGAGSTATILSTDNFELVNDCTDPGNAVVRLKALNAVNLVASVATSNSLTAAQSVAAGDSVAIATTAGITRGEFNVAVRVGANAVSGSFYVAKLGSGDCQLSATVLAG